jgi:hypothetical protein
MVAPAQTYASSAAPSEGAAHPELRAPPACRLHARKHERYLPDAGNSFPHEGQCLSSSSSRNGKGSDALRGLGSDAWIPCVVPVAAEGGAASDSGGAVTIRTVGFREHRWSVAPSSSRAVILPSLRLR